jgi:hypothetical protein
MEADRVLAGASRHALHSVEEVTIGRGESRQATRSGSKLALKLPGMFLSSRHARLLKRDAVWAVEDAGSKNGTRLNGKPLTQRRDLRDGDIIEAGDAFFLFRAAVAHVTGDRDDLASDDVRAPAEGLATLIPELAEMFRELTRAARKGFPSLLIQGETGTGKELAARAIHTLSGRSPRATPRHGVPFPSWGPSVRFPHFIGTTRRSDVPHAISPCFVAFARRYRRCALSSLPRARARLP